MMSLDRMKSTYCRNTPTNARIILENDRRLSGNIHFNLLTNDLAPMPELPWFRRTHPDETGVAQWCGAAKRRRALREDADVYVIGRDTLAWLTEEKGAPAFDMIVFDELTSFKNHRASRTKAALRLSKAASRVVGLTGTPTPQGMIDLFSQMLVVDLGERLGTSLTRYRNVYFDYYERNHIILNLRPKPDAERVINALLSDICLTMLSEEHNPLPELRVTDVPVPLSEGRLDEYRRFERDRVMELEGEDVTASTSGRGRR